jgi:hypothetical protein
MAIASQQAHAQIIVPSAIDSRRLPLSTFDAKPTPLIGPNGTLRLQAIPAQPPRW